jgi:cyclophilin family peptidyl-prolyl cis-trans isomerase
MYKAKIMKNSIFIFTAILILGFSGFTISQFPKSKSLKKDQIVTLSTRFGDMKIVLYDDTPLHKANFLKLIDEGYYDSTTFHRVIKQFMIQGGDPNSKDKIADNDGLGGPGYTIPAEFNPNHVHKKGALSAARQSDNINPKKESSGSQFYLVQGRKVNDGEFARMASFKKINYTEEQKKIYSELGGTPHLDGDYTVFGEVISGIDIIDSIAAVKTSRGDRPLENIYVKMSSDKVKRKKVSALYNYTYPALTEEVEK